MPIIGVWDDHDYGINNGGNTNTRKDIMKQIYLNFIKEPLNTARRLEKDTGIYQDYIITDSKSNIKIIIILLDVRYDYNKTT